MAVTALAGTAALAAALLAAPPAHAADTIVTDSAELIAAVHAANTTPGLDTIIVSGAITLAADIPEVTDSLVIRGADADATIDGAGVFGGIRAQASASEPIGSLTVESLTLKNILNTALSAFDVSAVSFADVTVDGATNQGVNVYAFRADDQIDLENIQVANVRYEAARLRMFSGATLTADGVHVRDSGRVDPVGTAGQGSPISVQAWHSGSQVTLQNISVAETSADRDTGDSPLAAVYIDAAGTSQVSIHGAEITGGQRGVWIEAIDAAGVALSNIAVQDNQLETLAVSAAGSASVAVSGFELAQGAAAGSMPSPAVDVTLREDAGLQLETGRIEQAQREGIDVSAGTHFSSGGHLVVRDVDVVDAVKASGIYLWGLESTELDAVTVSNAGWSGIYWGIGIVGSDDPMPNLSVRNSTISGTVEHGLAIDNGVPEVVPVATVDSSTIVGSARHGVFVYDRTGSDRFPADVTVRNSIVTSSAEMALTDNLAASLTSSHTLWNAVEADFAEFLAASDGGNIVGIDPELAPLADNGGTTRTHLPAAESPVIDAGDPAAADYAPALDQRGQSRIVGTIDLGSVEAGTVAEEPGDDDPGDDEPGDDEPGGGEPGDDEPGDGETGEEEPGDADVPEVTDGGAAVELPVITAPKPAATGETLPRTGFELESRLMKLAVGFLLVGTVLLAPGIRAARRRG